MGFFSERLLRSYQESDGRFLDVESLERAHAHFKRCMSFVTKRDYLVTVREKGMTYPVPSGKFVEGWVWNPEFRDWEPSYNGDLPMALGIFTSGLEKLIEATMLLEELKARHLPGRQVCDDALPQALGVELWAAARAGGK